MQMRFLLAAMITLSVALAGCAENATGPGDAATPPQAVTNAQAQSLFAEAAKNVPDKYGMDMKILNGTTELMTAQASYDQVAETSFFRLKVDPSLLDEMGEGGDGMGMMGDPSAFRDMSMYSSPEGNAMLINGTVMLTKPDDMMGNAAKEQDGFSTLSDPESFLTEMESDNFTVKSVTPTTLRGKGALKVEATIVEEGEPQNVTVWLFQDPTRVARIEATMPASDQDDDEDSDPFRGATMELDMLYDGEVTTLVPADLQRAMGLRYTSNRNAFSFGGEEGPEMWTFQASPATIPLNEVQAEVGSMMTPEEPAWTMLFSEGTKTEGGLTVTFSDVDSDGKVSKGDTLTIERGEDDQGDLQVALKDTKTGLRVVPGPGALLALVGLAAAILVARRR